MSYMHINNLYKEGVILMFKECYAMEKIHGTSTHIVYNPDKPELHFFAGGASHQHFVSLFPGDLRQKFVDIFANTKVYVYGEAYGGKLLGMSKIYGKNLGFVGFEVKVSESWLNVPNAHDVCNKLGLDFVDYAKIPTTIEAINAERDKPSTLAKVKNGVENAVREGVVLRPLVEFTLNNGERVIVKHKRDEFKETATSRHVEVDPEKFKILQDAKEIAEEWVTPMRLVHVLDKFPNATMQDTGNVIMAMQADVQREGNGELVWNDAVAKAVGQKTAQLLKKHLLV